MQTALKYFDLPTKDSVGAVEKVAGKIPGLDPLALDPAGTQFMEVMSALMQMAPEQLEDSLKHLDWVPHEGDGNGYAPLIDWSNRHGIGADVLSRLLEQANGDETASQISVGAMLERFNALAGVSGPEISETDPAFSNGDHAVKQVAILAAKAVAGNENGVCGQTDQLTVEQALPSGNGLFEGLRSGEEIPKPLSANAPMTDSLSAKLANPDGLPANAPMTDSFSLNAPNPDGLTASPVTSEHILSSDGLAKRLAPGEGVPERILSSEGGPDGSLKNPGKPVEEVHRNPSGASESRPDIAQLNGKQGLSHSGGQPHQDQSPAFKETFADQTDQESEDPLKKQSIPRNNREYNRTQPSVTAERDGAASRPSGEISDGGLRAISGKEALDSMISRERLSPLKSEWGAAAEKEMAGPSKELQNDVMRQIVQRMTMRSSGLKSQMNIRLKPEFLGNVHMQITTENHQVAVRMTAESMAVKEMIEQHIQHLRSELQQHGLEIAKFEVLVGNGSENWKSSQENAGFQQALHQKRHAKYRQRGDGSESENRKTPDPSVPKSGNLSGEIDYFV